MIHWMVFIPVIKYFFNMKTNYRKIALILILIGAALFVINTLDVFFGYKITYGKGFQVLGLILIVSGLVFWKIRS